MSFITALGTTALNTALADRRENRQYHRQKKLMDISNNYQRGLNIQGQQLAFDMWKKTNYPAQMAMIKEAGLNPALLYGMGGTGGATASSGSGGSAPSGNVSQASPMDINAIQAGLLNAQKKNIEADTGLKEAQAKKTSDVDTREAETRITSLTQGIENMKAQKALTEVQTSMQNILLRIQEATEEHQIDQAMWDVKRQIMETYSIGLRNKLDEQTIDDKAKIIKEEAIGKGLENILTKAKTNLTNAQIKQVSTSITQKWVELSQGQQKVDIQTFSEEIKAEYPSFTNSIGSIFNKLYSQLEVWTEDLTGAKPRRKKVKGGQQ